MPKKIHLGVTGLRRTGKTVFLTALIYQLSEIGSRNLDAFNNHGVTLEAAEVFNPSGGVIDTFPFARYRALLSQDPPGFPSATVRESGCVLRIKYGNTVMPGMVQNVKRWVGLGNSAGELELHLHDYPGEFLLDAPLVRKKTSFAQWSQETLERMHAQCPEAALDYEQVAAQLVEGTPAEILPRLRESYGRYALAARDLGLEFIQPAMTLLPWFTHCESSGRFEPPVAEELPFLPLPSSLREHPALTAEMQARFADHTQHRVKPFLKRLQQSRKQLVLVDVLRILKNGYPAYNDTRECLAQILRVYHDVWKPFGGVRQVLFAATKADHATRGDRPNLTRLLDELVLKARGKLRSGLQPSASEWFTSLRATQDVLGEYTGRPLELLLGTRLDGDQSLERQGHYPGPVPPEWPQGQDFVQGNPFYSFPAFAPVRWSPVNGAAVEHINLDRLLWTLLKDCF